MRVKICGIQSPEEAALALSAGADAIGLLVAEGMRTDRLAEDRIPASVAARILSSLPPFIASVLVTHLTDPGAIACLWESVPATTIQLHSDIDPGAVRALRKLLLPKVKLIGLVPIDARTRPEQRVRELEPVVDALLTDTRTADREGGTGRAHASEIDARVVRLSSRPVILAGGLTPENVAERIRHCRPWGVDVNSGVEDPNAPGPAPKDPHRLRRFVRLAKAAG